MNKPTLAVILAAGTGSRLAPYTDSLHKCMVPVAGRSILHRLFDELKMQGIKRVVMATGHLHEKVQEHALSYGGFEIEFAHSPDYATTNNVVSLWRARELISGPFLLLECDVVAESAVFAALMQTNAAVVSSYESSMTGSGILADASTGKGVERFVLNEEALQIKQDPERVQRLNKTVNLYSFDQASWQKHLLPALARTIDARDYSCFYEAAFAPVFNEGSVPLQIVNADAYRWIEIDTPEDLKKAEEMFSTKGSTNG